MPRIIVKDHKYYFKIRGLGGPKGDKGDTGPAGPQGPQGPYVNVVAGTTTTLPAGSSAQVTVNNTGSTSVLNFGIPQGSKGDKGDAGTPGAQGPRGFAATVNVGETTTGQPGTDASVVNAGNEHDAVLKFTIPKGEKGEAGETGPQGPTGGVKSTVVAELPETGESDKYYLVYRDSEGGTITTTDGRAQIENGENAGDLMVSQLLGNATQKTIAGNNLFNRVTAVENAGLKWADGNTYSETGSLSSGDFISAVAGEKFNLTYLAQVTFYDSSQNFIGALDLSGTGTSTSGGGSFQNFTVPDDANIKFLKLGFRQSYSQGVDLLAANIMVNKGQTLLPYEPYVGGIPAPNPDYPQPISTVTGAQTVVVTGKNLLDTSDPHDKTAGGVTATWNNGVVEVKGTNTATSFPLSDNIALPTQIKAGTEISASFAGASPGNVVFRFFNQATSQYEALAVANPNTSGTYTLTRDADAVQLYKGSVPANTYKEFSISNWQIEYGSQPSEYKPYNGAQSYEVNLGKNLLDINSLATTGITVSNGVATGAGNQFYASFGQDTDGVPFIKMGGQLSISLKAYTDGNQAIAENDGLVVRVIYTDGTSAIVIRFLNNQTTAATKTCTTVAGENVASVQLTYATNGGNVWHISEFQIEKGGQATSYAPYFAPIELAKIGTYQDRIYKDDGKWYIEKQVGKVVLDGATSEQWGGELYGGYWRAYHTFSDIAPITQNTDFVALSDYFHVSINALGAQSIGEGDFCQYRNTTQVYFAAPLSVQTSAEWRTWLSIHNTTVYYALATPTTTEITDETLLSQLNLLASLYGGTNNVSIVGAGPQGEFTGDYIVYDKYNRHKVYIWSSDDNTWQIIVQ